MIRTTHHLCWVTTLYMLQGMPYMAVTLLPIVAYKNLGIANTVIVLVTSLFSLPWILKPLFSSWVESAFTQRQWTYMTECYIGLLFILLAITLRIEHYFWLSVICFLLIGTFSALHDIASDGLYLNVLNLKQQYVLLGTRNACYQCARLLIQGGIIALAGFLLIKYNAHHTWSILFLFLGVLIMGFSCYHKFALPSQQKNSIQHDSYLQHFIHTTNNILKAWFKLPFAYLVVIFLLIYNACDAQLMRIVPIFFMTTHQQGGLGLNNILLSVSMTLGIIVFVFGSFVTSYLLKHIDLAKLIICSYALLVISNNGYIYLAYHIHASIYGTNIIYTISQLMFGISNGAYMAYLMHLANQQTFRAAFYTIATAIMSLSFMLFGFLSAPIVQMLVFKGFFIFTTIFGISILIFSCYFVKKGF